MCALEHQDNRNFTSDKSHIVTCLVFIGLLYALKYTSTFLIHIILKLAICKVIFFTNNICQKSCKIDNIQFVYFCVRDRKDPDFFNRECNARERTRTPA